VPNEINPERKKECLDMLDLAQFHLDILKLQVEQSQIIEPRDMLVQANKVIENVSKVPPTALYPFMTNVFSER